MRRLLSLRGIAYVIYTAIFFVLIFYMDTIPDHSDGTSDYSTWRAWLYFPVLTVYHGMMSKVILRGYGYLLPLCVTGIFGFTEAIISHSTSAPLLSLLENVVGTSPVETALVVAANHLIFTAIGMLISAALRLLYVFIKTSW